MENPSQGTNPSGDQPKNFVREIHIEICTNCRRHSFTTWHQEEKYIEVFEAVKKSIQAKNPDIQVIQVTGPEFRRGAFEIMHGEKMLFSKIEFEMWPGPYWMGDYVDSYFDDLANGRDVSHYGQMPKRPSLNQSMRKSQMSSSSLSPMNFYPNSPDEIGLKTATTSGASLLVPLTDQELEEQERRAREKRELERREQEREREERERLARERKEKERLRKEQERKDKEKPNEERNDPNKKNFTVIKGSRKIAATLLKELSICLEKSITTPITINGQSLVEFINSAKLLVDPATYAEPWELDIEGADKIKGSFIVVLYKYLEFLKFPEKEMNLLDFDITDSSGFTPLGIALAGGLSLTTCFVSETVFETNEGSIPYSEFFVLRNTVTSLIKLATKSKSKNPPTPDLRVGTGKQVYNNIYDVFLRHIFSPIPYNQNDQTILNLDASPEGDLGTMGTIREECIKILKMLDISKVDKKDLAVAAFEDKNLFAQLRALVPNPKEFYGAKDMHKDFVENMIYEYSTSKLETSFWSSSSILAFAGGKLLRGIFDILKSKELKYNPYKRNPVSGAYSFVWNAGSMEVSDLAHIINIGKHSREQISLIESDDFGFSFLNSAQVTIHNERESLLEFLKSQGLNLDLKAYHSYGKALKNTTIKKKREELFKWTKRVHNKVKWEIKYVTYAQDSYFYKTILEELSQINCVQKLDKLDISSVLLAHIARQICCWKGSVYDEDVSEDRAHRIHSLLAYLDAKEKQKQAEPPKPNPKANSDAKANQPIIDLKSFYEGPKGCNCRNVSDKIQNMPDGHDSLAGLFISLVDKVKATKPDPQENKTNVGNAEKPVEPTSYAEIALLAYLTLNKGQWETEYETYRSNSLWARFCFNCFQRYKDSIPKDKTLKSVPDKAKSQVVTRLLASVVHNEAVFQKYLKYAKTSGLRIDIITEFDGSNLLEKVLESKNVSVQKLLQVHMKETGLKFDLHHKNTHSDTLLNTFRDNDTALKNLSIMVETDPTLFVFGPDDTRDRCELLRRALKYSEALKILDEQRMKLGEEDLETLFLRAKIYESEGSETSAEEAKKVYREIRNKYSTEKNRVVLSTAVLNNQKEAIENKDVKNAADAIVQKKITKAQDKEKRKAEITAALYQLNNINNNTNDFTQVQIDFNKVDLLLEIGSEKEALNILATEFPKLEEIDLEPKLGKEKAQFLKQIISSFKKTLVISPEDLHSKEAKSLNSTAIKSFFSDFVGCLNKGLNAQDIDMLRSRLTNAEGQVDEMNRILKSSGLAEEDEVRKEFEKLRLSKDAVDNQRYGYAVNFYWTLQNYLEAERMMSTNMFVVDKDSFQKQTHQKNFVKMFVEKIFNTATEILEEVPVFGGLSKLVHKGVEWYFDQVDEKKQNDHVNAINNILKFYPGAMIQTQDITKFAAQAALKIAKKKSASDFKAKTDESIIAKIRKLTEDVKKAIIGEEIELYNSEEAMAAYQDVITVILYMCKEYKTLIDKEKTKAPFGERIAIIIIDKQYEKVLKVKEQTFEGTVNVKRSHCCEMF